MYFYCGISTANFKTGVLNARKFDVFLRESVKVRLCLTETDYLLKPVDSIRERDEQPSRGNRAYAARFGEMVSRL